MFTRLKSAEVEAARQEKGENAWREKFFYHLIIINVTVNPGSQARETAKPTKNTKGKSNKKRKAHLSASGTSKARAEDQEKFPAPTK